ncbi:MAG TPA: PfkB family carbohydrate kinase, partial [Ktedonobacteraceae bacterium]|nr:PfkB family carbohydrate kinase [Ktedonobacteraceae bacterium]
MSEVVTLGETMAVICPDQPHPLAEATRLTLDIAGAESNLAILLSRFGPRVSFISRVGNDAFGQRIRATLAVENLDLSHLMIDEDAPTGIFFREWLPDGKRRVLYYRADSAASRLSPEDLQPEMFQGARILHVTGITPA